MSVSIEQVAQALSIFNISDDVKTKVLAVLNISVGAQSVAADKPKAKKTDAAKPKKELSAEQKEALARGRKKAMPAHAARNACWKEKKAEGMDYKAFLAFWKKLSDDEKKVYSPSSSAEPSDNDDSVVDETSIIEDAEDDE
jgi:hypothetical protein